VGLVRVADVRDGDVGTRARKQATQGDRVVLVGGPVVGNDDLGGHGTFSCARSAAVDGRGWVLQHVAALLPSPPMIFVISGITVAYAQRGTAENPQGGRPPRVILRRGRCALLHPIGRVPADRRPRGGDRDGARGAPSTRGQPH